MKRNEHLFQFTGGQISEAAAKEHAYHATRLGYWRSEQEEAIKRAKAAGIDVREYDVTGGKQVNVIIDPEVTSRLSLCSQKINEHRTAADHFKIEADCYATQGDRVYELHPDDVIHFRLAGGSRTD